METLLTAALLLTVGALTPGPNNLLMLRIGVERGARAALLPASGVVLGGVVMLLAAAAGTAPLLAAHPGVRSAIVIGGALYVAWLGVRLIRSAGAPSPQIPAPPAKGALGMLLLQFVNPKSWVLVMTLTAASAGAASAPALAALTLLFVVIPFVCLTLWAAGGALAARVLQHCGGRAWFDRANGLTLVLCALLLVAG
jgi:threonine/homoserine/homoserine lactone efflux protein